MLLAILLAELMMIIYMTGFLIASISVTRHGNPNATYRICAVRDQLINSIVFERVDRDDPWLVALRKNVNRVLLHSNVIGGHNGWSRADVLDQFAARMTSAFRSQCTAT